MLKRMITYTDFNGQEQTELFYFNLTNAEMLELSVSRDGDLNAYIERIIDEDDRPAIIGLVKDLILSSYGKKSDDGKSFVKSEKLKEEFACSAAYSALFTELFLDEKKQVAFMNAVIPPDWDDVKARLEKAAREAQTPAQT